MSNARDEFLTHVHKGSRTWKIVCGIEMGLSEDEIARRFRTGRKVINVYRRALNGELTQSSKTAWNWRGPEFYREIGELIQAGAKAQDIAARYKVKMNRAYYIIRQCKTMKKNSKL